LAEVKNDAELRVWPISWLSRNRLSRWVMLPIQRRRTTVMLVLSTPLERDRRLSPGW
jgi:hypothetical protein